MGGVPPEIRKEARGAGAGAHARDDGSAPRSVVERFAASAFASLSDGLVLRDLNSGEEWANATGRRYRNARHEDAIAEQGLDRVIAAAESGNVAGETIELLGPPRRVLMLRAAPLFEAGAVVGVCATVRDVTEAALLEAVRQDFVANVSHELKTPIGALVLVSELLATEQDPAAVRDLAPRAHAEATRLAAIVDDLLDLSTIEIQAAQGLSLVEHVELSDVAREALARFGEAATRVALSGATGPETTINGDRRQLVSAIANLVDNALKYSDGESSIEARVSIDHANVCLTVSDHGVGIPARDLERVFERFYRVDRARSRDTGGTGLGLAIVRNVVTANHGTLEIESVEGEGTSITLRFPKVARP